MPNAGRRFGSSVVVKRPRRNGKYMKKEKTSKAHQQADDEMRPEYDFRGGVRGKHYQAYRRGHTAAISKTSGSKGVEQFALRDCGGLLGPDGVARLTRSVDVESG